jgi:hypothetical protein
VDTANGELRRIPPGQLPEPTDRVVVRFGEPTFQVRLADALRTDEDLADAVGIALRRAAVRLTQVMSDGQESPDGSGPVEWVVGPTVHNGAVAMYLDTDGDGFTKPMIEAMANIFVEELVPLGVYAEVSVSPAHAEDMGPAWMSSTERQEG